MSDRPQIDASVTASFTADTPKRFVRKLDKDPQLALAWDWQVSGESAVIKTDKGESVALTISEGVVRERSDVSCTCLLAPRCLHVLAVVSLLDVAAAVGEQEAQLRDNDASEDGESLSQITLGDSQREAAHSLRLAASAVLINGAHASGAMIQADLLRAVHAARIHGLARAAAAGLSLVRYMRDLRAGRSSFVLSEMSDCLLEILIVTELLAEEKVALSAIGKARRSYHEVGNLRLYGLFCEPILSQSGYAGVRTILCDEEARLYSLSDVMPADSERAIGAYHASADIGGSSIPHRDLARTGLYIQGATVSQDGRLGRGAKVTSSRAPACSWFDEALEKLWSVPLGAQLDRVQRALEEPLLERSAGWDFLFLDGQVIGRTESGVIFQTAILHESTVLELVVPLENERLHFRDNLASLGRACDLKLRVVGRVQLGETRQLAALAVAPAPSGADAPKLMVPEAWSNRICLGMDLLTRSYFEKVPTKDGSVLSAEAPYFPDPLVDLRRTLRRAVLGGIATLPPEARPRIRRQAAQLQSRMMPTGASVLLALLDGALTRNRDQEGKRGDVDILRFANSWSEAAQYEAVAAIQLERAFWQTLRT